MSDTARLRQFLSQRFNDSELIIFCFDYFPVVQQEFSDGMRRSRKIQLLLEHCRNQGKLPQLLAALQRERPDQAQQELADPLQKRILPRPQLPIPSQHNPRQIFLSHASQDILFAQRLAHDLRESGWPVWIAFESIRPGEKWVEAINRGLEESGIFLLIMTPAAANSHWVRDETSVAISLHNKGKALFLPLLFVECDVPLLWRVHHWIRFTEQYEVGWYKLQEALDAKLKSHVGRELSAPKAELPKSLESSRSQPLTQREKEVDQRNADRFYAQLLEAAKQKNWVKVIELSGQVQALVGEYRDVLRLVYIAHDGLRQEQLQNVASSTVFSTLLEDNEMLIRTCQDSGYSPQLLQGATKFVKFIAEAGNKIENIFERRMVQTILDYWSNVLYGQNKHTISLTLAHFDPSIAPVLTDEDNPYVGLDPFVEANHHLFFGRQTMVNRLVKHLQSERFLAVVGSSGSGKSSLVLAGLLPQLKNNAVEESGNWHYYPPFVPGSNPLINLAIAIGQEFEQDTIIFWQEIRKFQRHPKHLLRLVNNAHAQPVVFVIDQFEETFTLCTNPQIRYAFIENLIQLVQAPESRHTVILTMRIDFENYIAQLEHFLRLYTEARVVITPLTATELRTAIIGPAKLVNLQFTDNVADLLVQDILGEPAALPLLQFTLSKMWNMRDRNRITRSAYNQLGGGRLALSTSANAFYESLLVEDQRVVRWILLNMVRPTAGLEVTNNRIRRSDLFRGVAGEQRIAIVLDRLIDEGLVRESAAFESDDTQIEIAHEALIRNWEKLVDWIAEEREAIHRRLRLMEAAENWDYLEREEGALLQQGSLYEEAIKRTDLTPLELDFVQASRRRIQSEQKD